MVQLANQEGLPGLGLTADREGFIPLGDGPAQLQLRHYLPCQRFEAEALVVIEVEPLKRVTWYMTAERLDVELLLSDAGDHHTRAELVVSGPFLVGLRRSLPRNALRRLHALCQTAAEL